MQTPSLDLRDSAARFESGSANMIGAAALSASLQMIIDIRNELGQHAISEPESASWRQHSIAGA